uniref:Uncharacterized protein n=1 Tax=viral metagenome TaxID=1070528 RepID=A0A6M3K2M6_9ZZZZ
MIITLNNGRQVEVKAIDLAHGRVDYRRIDDPVYGGDCVLYHQFSGVDTAESEIKATLDLSEAEREAAQTIADIAAEEARLAKIAKIEARLLSINTNLPSWAEVEIAINAVDSLAKARAVLLKLARVVYWLAKNEAD